MLKQNLLGKILYLQKIVKSSSKLLQKQSILVVTPCYR